MHACSAAGSVQDNFHTFFHKYDQTLDQKEPFSNPEKKVFLHTENKEYLGNLRCVEVRLHAS